MAIKTVACPQCGMKLNVPSTMGNAKCSSCNQVFSTKDPQAARPTDPDEPRADSAAKRGDSNWVAWAVSAGVFAAAVIGIVGLTIFGGNSTDEPEPATSGSVTASDSGASDSSPADAVAVGDYREVNLPESTRRKIFRDYQAMIASSFGKAKKIPQGGAAGQALGNMLGATVEREITRMALIYGISEDDIAQIVLEGKAKGW